MTLHLEEEIIAHARENPERLPTLEMILDRLVLSLAPAFKSYTSILPEVTAEHLQYLSCAEAIDALPSNCIISVASTAPWTGRIACVVEPDLLFTVLEMMLGGSAKKQSEWTPRSFTAIERSIGQRIAELVTGVLETCFRPVAETTLSHETTETLPKALVLAQPVTPSVRLRLRIDLDGRVGHIVLILPYGNFDTMRGLLALPYHGGTQEGMGGWRGEMGQRLVGSDARVSAVLTSIRVPLSRMLGWQKGDVVELGVATDHEVTGKVNGTDALRGAFGHRANGSLAIRVTERLIDSEEALHGDVDPD